MEEAKAAAYYDELSRKGEGAARFKQGLGYSAADAAPSWRSSSSALLSGFVRASAGGKSDPDAAKEAQLSTIKAKLAGKSDSFRGSDRRSSRGSNRREERWRSRSRSRSRSPRRERSERRRKRSRTLSPPERGRRKGRRSRTRSRSPSPRLRERSGRENREDHRSRSSRGKEKEKGGSVDYLQLIEGYSNMTAAERVKAKMKLQLSQTAAKDKIMGKGWERFEFDKDAPLDDEEIEVADDDANLVKDMDRTFRFSSMEAKREADLESAHDQAIFGVPSALPYKNEDAEGFRGQDSTDKSTPDANLTSEKVLSAQQGSWRDKVRNRQKG